MMDKIEFRYRKFSYGMDDYAIPAVEIFINGRDFMECVAAFEREVCGKEQGHAPLTPRELYEGLHEDYKEDSVYIYGCTCGCPDCCPFYVEIHIVGDTVVWHDFEMDFYENRDCVPLGPFVFDKRQYFAEVDKLRLWMGGDTLRFYYGGIEYGYLTLVAEKGEMKINMVFDELLSDPMPQIVHFLTCVKSDALVEEELLGHLDEPLLQISANGLYRDMMLLEMRFPQHDVIFSEILSREAIATVFQRIADGLLQDDGFIFMYPCYWYLDATSFDRVSDEAEEIGKDLSQEEQVRLLVRMLREANVPLEADKEEYAEKYRRMLAEYVIPEGWYVSDPDE